jgi:hypothetical protein
MVPDSFTSAPVQPASGEDQNATNDLPHPSRGNKLEKEIATLLEEYSLKDFEQHTANHCAAVTLGQGPNRLGHSRIPSLEALAKPSPPKLARFEDPRPSKLHDVCPPFYEGKSQKELDEFVKVIERIFLPDEAYYPTEHVRALYASQYLKGIPSQRWKHYICQRDPKSLTWAGLKNVF